MKKIAIIGANEYQNKLIISAKLKGIETHVFSWDPNDVGVKSADYFYHVDIVDIESILNTCVDINIDGICSIGSDLANITVNSIANKLGLIGNSSSCTSLTTNKYLMRNRLKEAGCPIPQYQLVKSASEFDINLIPFPCIVKPIDRSGSRGIQLIDELGYLENAIENSIDYSFVDTALVEEFIEGREFSIEAISRSGKHKILQVTEKFTTGSPNFIEKGHLAPARITKREEQRITSVIEKALNSLEIENGASHSEVKISKSGEVKIIEIGSRMGGDFIGSDLVKINLNFDFTNAVIDIALDNDISLPDTNGFNQFQGYSLVYFFFNEQQYNNFCELKSYADVEIHDLNFQSSVESKISSSQDRLGYSILQFPVSAISLILEKLGLNSDKI